MTRLLTREEIACEALVHTAPPATQPATDRSFELPPVLYKATVGCYLGFLAVMTAGLGNPGLVIPMVIFAVVIVAGFALPTIWVRMEPEHPGRAMTWARLVRDGVATHTGRVTARDAAVQMLVLPVLILLWGVTTVVIAAAVG